MNENAKTDSKQQISYRLIVKSVSLISGSLKPRCVEAWGPPFLSTWLVWDLNPMRVKMKTIQQRLKNCTCNTVAYFLHWTPTMKRGPLNLWSGSQLPHPTFFAFSSPFLISASGLSGLYYGTTYLTLSLSSVISVSICMRCLLKFYGISKPYCGIIWQTPITEVVKMSAQSALIWQEAPFLFYVSWMTSLQISPIWRKLPVHLKVRSQRSSSLAWERFLLGPRQFMTTTFISWVNYLGNIGSWSFFPLEVL